MQPCAIAQAVRRRIDRDDEPVAALSASALDVLRRRLAAFAARCGEHSTSVGNSCRYRLSSRF
jgi:hypothetical protein